MSGQDLTPEEAISKLDCGDTMTIGERYHPAMKIEDEELAGRYFNALVGHRIRKAQDEAYKTRKGAEQVEKSNLGYFAGYYDHETRRRVERLFSCAHRVFGSIEQFGAPTAAAAFQSGLEHGRR